MSEENRLVNPDCPVARPWFLWFKQHRHEPNEKIDRLIGPLHVRVGRTAAAEGDLVHVVGVVCRHCEQPYFEPYRWTHSISWNNWREVWPDSAWRDLNEKNRERVQRREYLLELKAKGEWKGDIDAP